jgi:hypothetical protein
LPHFLSRSVLCRSLFAAVVLASFTASAHAVSCTIRTTHNLSPAEDAYLHGDLDHAVSLYQEQLAKTPNDPALTAGLVQVLLRQQKVQDADDLVQKALVAQPQSAILKTTLGEVQYRQGTLWLVGATVAAAAKLDPCEPRTHLLAARYFRINSLYGAAATEIDAAHKLDPNDPGIRRQWLDTQPLQQRIASLESYLATPTGDDPDQLKSLHRYLEYLKKSAAEPHKACRLVSDTSTTIPFAPLMRDATHVRAYGLDVKLNNHNARLQIDTGAGGIIISRSVAKRAGLDKFAETETGGVGDQGRKSSYVAYVDDIKIGALEFQDCEVEVIDQSNVVDLDGLIGMDVFSRFLVTLDYPVRKLILGPLPPRPDDVQAAKPSLRTTDSADDDSGAPVADAAASTAAKTVPRGPRDRYISPEMKNWTPVYRVGHNLLLPASLNDTSVKLFILDTGAFATTISPGVARAVTKVHTNSDITVKGISGKVDMVYTADSITFKFANLSQLVQDVVAFDTPQVSKGLNMEVSGFIGITALGQVTTTIDYRDGLVKFIYDANRNPRF